MIDERRTVEYVQTQDCTPCSTASTAPSVQVCLVQATCTVTSLAVTVSNTSSPLYLSPVYTIQPVVKPVVNRLYGVNYNEVVTENPTTL